MKIAILDDELHCVESLVSDIDRLFPELPIVYKGTKPLEATEVLKRIDIDLLFLDVEMPLMNGFDFLNQFDELPFDVIFTTAYSQYAIKAFSVQAVDYLLKPIDEDELKETLDQHIEKSCLPNDPAKGVTQLLRFLKNEGILKNKLALPTEDGMEFIEIANIDYCQRQSDRTKIFTLGGRSILISKDLNEVEKSLTKFLFMRVHQSYLVNPNCVAKYIRNDGGYLILANNQRIPVSNSAQELIIEAFERLHD
jgi:two-component system LytT family response regulator